MPNTIQALLAAATEQLAALSETAALDAEILLCDCLNKNRSFLRAWPEHKLNNEQENRFRMLVAQRRDGMPIAYLTGQREFWSRNFKVTPDVLIPRPDTESLVEIALSLIPVEQNCKIIDLGAGSGILAITLAAERPLAKVTATDICAKALTVAAENAAQHHVTNISFLQSNWFEAVTERDFDLIVSNPPYIAYDDPHLQQGDVRFEPKSALISADNGLQDIRAIAREGCRHLKCNGHLLIEHGYNQQAEVQAIFKALNYGNIETHADLPGNPRVTSGLWKPV